MEALQLPTENLTSAYILNFLVHHDLEDLAPAAQEEAKNAIAPDIAGWINLSAKYKTFDIRLKNGWVNKSQWTYERGHPVWTDLSQAPGTLYTAPHAPLPQGKNTIWIQQYPPKSQKVGRTVIEFYTDSVITAVFKTDVDNWGGGGQGYWYGK